MQVAAFWMSWSSYVAIAGESKKVGGSNTDSLIQKHQKVVILNRNLIDNIVFLVSRQLA